MKRLLKKILLSLNVLRLGPALLFLWLHPKKALIKEDIARWTLRHNMYPDDIIVSENMYAGFIHFMTFKPEFRSLFYKRVGRIAGALLQIFCWPRTLLFLWTDDIGPGCVIFHGFSTVITGKIGKNLIIYQHVDIAYGNGKTPTIGDNVTIATKVGIAGEVIIGDNVVINMGAQIAAGKMPITIGKNSIIAMGAVVNRSVPPYCVVAGNPAFIVKQNGKKVHIPLIPIEHGVTAYP